MDINRILIQALMHKKVLCVNKQLTSWCKVCCGKSMEQSKKEAIVLEESA